MLDSIRNDGKWRARGRVGQSVGEKFSSFGGSVGGRLGRNRTVVWEKFYCFDNAFGFCCSDIDLVAAIMFHGRAKVPAVDSVDRPRWALVGSFKDENLGAGGCQRSFIKIKGAIKLGAGVLAACRTVGCFGTVPEAEQPPLIFVLVQSTALAVDGRAPLFALATAEAVGLDPVPAEDFDQSPTFGDP